MANFPYTTSGTTTINADQTITLVWQLQTSIGTVVHSDTVNFPPETVPSQIFETLLEAAKNYILQDLAASDLPATFNFFINTTDLM